ncbi:MAG: aldo/keto reductase [Dehalococcoidia bacterium]|nr:aldo/keto reductase [Dehalococcoidia bacterium]
MTLPQLPYGRTGHLSSRMIFGAAALGKVPQDEADPALDILLAHGVNHIDVAASYGDAELRLKPWLRQHRKDFFLATKTNERRAEGAREELHRSLDRLGVDRIDLWQLHNLSDPIQWDTALSPGGAIEAAVEAREQGLVGAIGVTGHGIQVPAAHRRSLARFDFDSVLLPYNYLTMRHPYYAENFDALQAACRERNVAMQTIKSIAYRPWMGRPRSAATWYDPLTEQPDVDRAVHWALGRSGIFVITSSELSLLPKVLDAAERFETVTADGAMEEMVGRLAMEPIFV